MKLITEPRLVSEKSLKAFVRHGKIALAACLLERIRKAIKPPRSTRTGRKLLAAVLHGPRDLKLECIPEVAVQPTQVRVDVRFCGLNGSDVLMWRGEHRAVPAAVLGFEVSGNILEMGGLAHERTGYQITEEVVVHNYPVCGGLAESCLAHYRDVFRLMRRVSAKNAAAVTDDYFSALLTMGRRARLRTGEYFLVNAERCSSSALAVIDLAAGVFGAKPIAVCGDARQAKLFTDLGAAVIRDDNRQRLPCEVKQISGKEEVRVIIDTENGSIFDGIIECLEIDGLVAFLGSARNRRCSTFYPTLLNYTMFAVSAEHYKVADTLVYRETMEHLLDYQSECVIRPRISAIFGLHRVNDAFEYCTTMPSGKVLIDMKDRDRLTVFDVCDSDGL